MIKAAMLLLLPVGVGLAILAGSAAFHMQQLGLDSSQRPIAIAIISAAQFGGLVIGSAILAAWGLGPNIVPRMRPYLPNLSPDRRTSLSVQQAMKGAPLRIRLRIAAAVLVAGILILALAVPIQAMLVVWLVAQPSLLLPSERFIVSAEVVLAASWLGYLVARIALSRATRVKSRPEPP